MEMRSTGGLVAVGLLAAALAAGAVGFSSGSVFAGAISEQAGHGGPVDYSDQRWRGYISNDQKGWQTLIADSGWVALANAPVAVSADIRKGKAMVRLFQTDGSGSSPGLTGVAKPKPVRFIPGASSYTFAAPSLGTPAYRWEIQWKRLSKGPVVAASASASLVGQPD